MQRKRFFRARICAWRCNWARRKFREIRSSEAKELYKERAATAECVNALARQRGLLRLRVRGTVKVRGVLLMYALAHNLMRTFALAPELLGRGVGAPSGIAMET